MQLLAYENMHVLGLYVVLLYFVAVKYRLIKVEIWGYAESGIDITVETTL